MSRGDSSCNGAPIKERRNGERFAIDSSSGENGENPTVQAAASFYVPDSYAGQTPPETGAPIAEARIEAPDAGGGLTGFLDRMNALGYADGPTGSVR